MSYLDYYDPSAETTWREERTSHAEKLLKLRTMGRECNIPMSTLIGHYRLESPPRPTVENFMAAALNCATFAQSGWTSHDTEYYSTCGWDDYQGERRDAAKACGIGCWRAAIRIAFGVTP